MPNPIIERAARVLAKAEYPNQPESWHDENWHEWSETSRTVLRAIREPSEEMNDAGGDVGDNLTSFAKDGSAFLQMDAGTKIWQAMIDAALGEE